MAIHLIAGLPGMGKTALMSHIGREAMFDKKRYRKGDHAIRRKQRGGFNVTIPAKHFVYGNYELIGKKPRYKPRYQWDIDPRKLAYHNHKEPWKTTHFLPPYAVILVTEAQDYFDSRNYQKFTREQSAYFEQHRHNNYDIYLDAQRYDLIDPNIRNISIIIDVQSCESITDQFGRVIATKWVVHKFASGRAFDQYVGGKNVEFEVETIIADYDIHTCFDSQMMEPRFYEGHYNDDFCQDSTRAPKQTKEDYIEYNAKRRSYDDS